MGFLLEELHEECLRCIQQATDARVEPDTAQSARPSDASQDDGWLEVGPRQKAAVTRSSGYVTEDSPITSIFGGKLRSELRVHGAKNSVTLEPYQSLQLDIGSPHVESITDALKALTRPEILQGEFASSWGSGATATKQVFIEILPPVLILHLKRFQYDNTGGTQKIWKEVGYPLDLDLPKELFPSHLRGRLSASPPRYRLTAVIYHHGKSASGGHYTVDVRHQVSRQWLRLDDTAIHDIRSEEVALGSPEQNPRLLEIALQGPQRDLPRSRALRAESGPEDGWSRVNSGVAQPAKSAIKGVAQTTSNGAKTPRGSLGRRTPVERTSSRENKVAYLLFYEKLGSALHAVT